MSGQAVTTILGTDNGRRVHLAWARTATPLCGRPPVAAVLADLDDDSGQEGTLAALINANVAHSRLCRACFYPKFRALYKGRVTNQ